MTSVAAEPRSSVWPITAVRMRLGLVALLVALAVVAWWWTAREMRGMDGGPWTEPRRARLVRRCLGGDDGRDDVPVGRADGRAVLADDAGRARRCPASLFVGGYLIPWAVAGLAAYGVAAAGGELAGGVLDWDRAGPLGRRRDPAGGGRRTS